MIEIRTLTVLDMDDVIILKVNAWEEETSHLEKMPLSAEEEKTFWTSWMLEDPKADKRNLIGAYIDDQLVGACFASFAETTDIPENGLEINGLWVHPSYRNQSISLLLLQSIMQTYLPLGIRFVVVYNVEGSSSNTYYQYLGATLLRKDLQCNGKLPVLVYIFQADKLYERILELLSNKTIQPLTY